MGSPDALPYRHAGDAGLIDQSASLNRSWSRPISANFINVHVRLAKGLKTRITYAPPATRIAQSPPAKPHNSRRGAKVTYTDRKLSSAASKIPRHAKRVSRSRVSVARALAGSTLSLTNTYGPKPISRFQERSVAKGIDNVRGYGTWLHGDERGSVDRRYYNAFNSAKIKPDAEKESRKATQLKHEPFILNAARRTVIEAAIREVCTFRSYALHAIDIRTNHVHLVAGNGGSPEH